MASIMSLRQRKLRKIVMSLSCSGPGVQSLCDEEEASSSSECCWKLAIGVGEVVGKDSQRCDVSEAESGWIFKMSITSVEFSEDRGVEW